MNVCDLHISSIPYLNIIEIGDSSFVAYNSVIHCGIRVSKLELYILELYYKFQDADYIIQQFDSQHQLSIQKAINFIASSKILSASDNNVIEPEESVSPSIYYVHLTYNCNLHCTYCYNAEIRKTTSLKLLHKSQWMTIVDKIISSATTIVFTGGECFLSPYLGLLAEYIKKIKPECGVQCMSNGMFDLNNKDTQLALAKIDGLGLSCDSLTTAHHRIGFNAQRFRHNIETIQQQFPHIQIAIHSTLSSDNVADIQHIKDYCLSRKLNHLIVTLSPGCVQEIRQIPSTLEVLATMCNNCQTPIPVKALSPKRFRCGAAQSVISIDPFGNVYPCQCLHYPEFEMGNLLHQELSTLKYIVDGTSPIPSVDEFAQCQHCDVKYICGGGCKATGYRLYGGVLKPNHLSCLINRQTALAKLKL